MQKVSLAVTNPERACLIFLYFHGPVLNIILTCLLVLGSWYCACGFGLNPISPTLISTTLSAMHVYA